MTRALLLLATCAVLVCACGSTAHPPRFDHRIGLDHRIGAVSFGERKDRVDAAIGPGVSKNPTALRGSYIFYPLAKLYVGYYKHGGHEFAFAIITESPRYKTPSGAGVGTTLGQLRRRVKVICDGDGAVIHGKVTHPSADPEQCSHEGANINHPFTAFVMGYETKRVAQIQIVPGGD